MTTDTILGGTVTDWHAAYLALHNDFTHRTAMTPEQARVYWPTDRLPITRPTIERTP